MMAKEAPRKPIPENNLPNEAFLLIVRKHGTDKGLFATGSLWEDQKDCVARIHAMDLALVEKHQILGENARKLLALLSSGIFEVSTPSYDTIYFIPVKSIYTHSDSIDTSDKTSHPLIFSAA